MFGFVTYYKSLKIIGLNFLAIESNNFRFICPHSLVLLGFFAIGEIIIFLYFYNKLLDTKVYNFSIFFIKKLTSFS